MAVEPLSAGRFKITFTAGADLKRKLELARDLLRHAVPQGDLATIVSRALDLLIEKTERRRFAKTRKPKKEGPTPGEGEEVVRPATFSAGPLDNPDHSAAAPTSEPATATRADAFTHCSESTASEASAHGEASALHELPTPRGAFKHGAAPQNGQALTPQHPSRHIPNEVRRAVLERDGDRCTWQAPDGTRCNSRAWIEYDHIIPRGQGGTDDPANIRPCCRAHNRVAAERAYGQATITRIIARRQANRPPPPA